MLDMGEIIKGWVSSHPDGRGVVLLDIVTESGQRHIAELASMLQQRLEWFEDALRHGIHGFPGGDTECFCLWPVPNEENEHGAILGSPNRDQWQHPDDIKNMVPGQSGTLVWIPDGSQGDAALAKQTQG